MYSRFKQDKSYDDGSGEVTPPSDCDDTKECGFCWIIFAIVTALLLVIIIIIVFAILYKYVRSRKTQIQTINSLKGSSSDDEEIGSDESDRSPVEYVENPIYISGDFKLEGSSAIYAQVQRREESNERSSSLSHAIDSSYIKKQIYPSSEFNSNGSHISSKMNKQSVPSSHAVYVKSPIYDSCEFSKEDLKKITKSGGTLQPKDSSGRQLKNKTPQSSVLYPGVQKSDIVDFFQNAKDELATKNRIDNDSIGGRGRGIYQSIREKLKQDKLHKHTIHDNPTMIQVEEISTTM